MIIEIKAAACDKAGLAYGDGANLVNCSTALGHELEVAIPWVDWRATLDDGRDVWDDLMIRDGTRPWSDMQIIVDVGAGEWVCLPREAEQGEAYACQRWLVPSVPSDGHAWTCYLAPDGTWRRIDATGREPDGTRREHGALQVQKVTWETMANGSEVRAVRLFSREEFDAQHGGSDEEQAESDLQPGTRGRGRGACDRPGRPGRRDRRSR